MVAGYYFQRPVLLFFSLRSWITCGDPNVLRGGYNALSRLRRIRSFLFLRLGKRACPLINKNALSALLKGHCAQDWIRTSTSLRTLRPEHSASTNFATRAFRWGTANIRFNLKKAYGGWCAFVDVNIWFALFRSTWILRKIFTLISRFVLLKMSPINGWLS